MAKIFEICLLAASLLGGRAVAAVPAPTGLRADGTNLNDASLPQYALGRASPRLEWAPAMADRRGALQNKFSVAVHEVVPPAVSSSQSPSSSLRLAWASGLVESGIPSCSVEPGKLESGKLYEWRVSIVDDRGAASASSAPARFRVSLLDDVEWAGVPWVGSQTLNSYRTTVASAAANEDAVLYVCGLGYASVSVNGKRIPGQQLVTSPWTANERTNGFSAYDISAALARPPSQAGTAMTIEIDLGHGWRDQSSFPDKDAGEPGSDKIDRVLRAQLRVGGQVVSHTGDGKWQAAAGPVTFDSVYNGEHYDATRAATLAEDPAAQWTAAPVLAAADSPRGAMVPWAAPPVTVEAEVAPVKITPSSSSSSSSSSSVYVVDFGVNQAGVVRLTNYGPCPRGTTITLKHAEIMQHAGLPDLGNKADPTKIYQGNLRSAQATDVYTCSGAPGGETWAPRFTYHGFRFVEVTISTTGSSSDAAAPPAITKDNVVMLHLHSDVKQRTKAHFASDTLNRIQAMALGAQRSNMMTVPTDCDQRDERLGWMGDANLSGDSMALNFDATAFLSFFLDTIVSEEGADGSVPDVVPLVRYGSRPGDVSWSSALANLADVVRTIGSDPGPAARHLPAILKQLEQVKSQAAQGLAQMHTPYGDWCPPPAKMGGGQGPKPSKPYTSAFSYLNQIYQARDMANATGNATLAASLAAEAAQVAGAFNKAFLGADGCYDGCTTQTAQALALQLGVPTDPARTRQALVGLITNSSANPYPGHYTVGIIGFKFLFDALKAAGHEELALTMLSQTAYPSIGYYFANPQEPASANLWELPDANAEGTGMNSRNHHMWSSFSAYLVRSVAGVDPSAASAAASAAASPLMLRPATVAGISGAEVEMALPSGTVSMAWRNHGGTQTDRAAGGVGGAIALDCGSAGGVIESVSFASFGSPALRNLAAAPSSLDFTTDPTAARCHAASSRETVASRCEGRAACTVAADAALFPDLPAACHADVARPPALWAQAKCSQPLSVRVQVRVPVAASHAATLELPLHRLAAGTPGTAGTVGTAPSPSSSGVVHVLEGGKLLAVVDASPGRAPTLLPATPAAARLPEGLRRNVALSVDGAGRAVGRLVLGSGSFDFELRSGGLAATAATAATAAAK